MKLQERNVVVKIKEMHKLPSLSTLILIKRDVLILIFIATDLGQIFF